MCLEGMQKMHVLHQNFDEHIFGIDTMVEASDLVRSMRGRKEK